MEEDSSRYRSLLTLPVDERNTVYPKAQHALSKLSPHEIDHAFRVADIVIVDTASAILGTLDATHFPAPLAHDFIIKFDDEVIQGDLQDLFNKKA